MSRKILITGAGRGLGLAFAERLSSDGFDLVMLSKSEESCQVLQDRITGWSGSHVIFCCNLEDESSIVRFTRQWSGELWGLVNNAGICETLPLAEDNNQDPWGKVLQTNLTAPYFLTKKMLKFISKPGRIINISSQLGLDGRADYSAYCASKFGLIGLTKVWAKELGSCGITVNAICPGWVDTDMSRVDVERLASQKGITSLEFYSEICRPLELKRFNTPAEVADLVSYLLSDAAGGVSGQSWLLQNIWNQ